MSTLLQSILWPYRDDFPLEIKTDNINVEKRDFEFHESYEDWLHDWLADNDNVASMSTEKAMTISSFFGCVSFISRMMASLPLELRKKNKDKHDLIEDHHTIICLSNPNDFQTDYEFREMMEVQRLLYGNALAIKELYRGVYLEQLYPVEAPFFIPYCYKNGSVNMGYMLPGGKKVFRIALPGMESKSYFMDEVFSYTGMSKNGLFGLSPISYARHCLALEMYGRQYGINTFKNNGRPTGTLNYAKKLSKDDKASLRESWRAMNSQGGTAILDQEVTYHPISALSKDCQWLETRQFEVPEICRFFGVAPHLVYDLTQSTNNNIEQQSLEAVIFSLTPSCERSESAMDKCLLTAAERANGYYFAYNLDGLLRGDSTARANFYQKAILTGWMSRNEARIREQLQPLDGLDTPLVPGNMMVANANGEMIFPGKNIIKGEK